MAFVCECDGHRSKPKFKPVLLRLAFDQTGICKIKALLTPQTLALARHYTAALSGAGGRLVISLFYFIALANSLSVAEFGLFATASATGVVLSRIIGFGFTSPLYRAATVKPRIMGVFAAGYVLAALISLPLFALAGWLAYAWFFAGGMSATAFVLVLVSEALLWRTAEVIIIVNNGINRFGRGSILTILGTAFRAVAALVFSLLASKGLDVWAGLYLAANATSLLVGIAFFMPAMRWRLALPLYWRHIGDALAVASAEVLFYVQSELDKVLVLSLGGPETAGIYAIVIRLVDLTAIPIRTFNMMLVQKLMRSGALLKGIKWRVGMEAGLFAVSTFGFAVLAGFLQIFPNALGRNVATVTALLFAVLWVPGFRNLVEYHAELLYARRRTGLRMVNLGLLGAAKAVLLAALFVSAATAQNWLSGLNLVYAVLWLASALLTYSAVRSPDAKPSV